MKFRQDILADASLCSKCGGAGFYFKKKKRITCYCTALKKIISYAPDFYTSVFKIDAETRKKIFDCFKPSARQYFFQLPSYTSEDVVRGIVFLYCMFKGFPKFEVLNTYELVEIFFQIHPRIKAITDFTPPLCVLMERKEEMQNPRRTEVVLQFLDVLRVESDILYIALREPVAEVNYYFVNNGWEIFKWVGEGLQEKKETKFTIV